MDEKEKKEKIQIQRESDFRNWAQVNSVVTDVNQMIKKAIKLLTMVDKDNYDPDYTFKEHKRRLDALEAAIQEDKTTNADIYELVTILDALIRARAQYVLEFIPLIKDIRKHNPEAIKEIEKTQPGLIKSLEDKLSNIGDNNASN